MEFFEKVFGSIGLGTRRRPVVPVKADEYHLVESDQKEGKHILRYQSAKQDLGVEITWSDLPQSHQKEFRYRAYKTDPLGSPKRGIRTLGRARAIVSERLNFDERRDIEVRDFDGDGIPDVKIKLQNTYYPKTSPYPLKLYSKS